MSIFFQLVGKSLVEVWKSSVSSRDDNIFEVVVSDCWLREPQTFMDCIWNSLLVKANILRVEKNFRNLESFFVKGYVL